MIRYRLIAFFAVFVLFSWKYDSSIDVHGVIQKYKLNYNTAPIRSAMDNSLHGDGILFASIHGNTSTDSCLYILRNYKNDTLLVHLDEGIGNYYHSQILKQQHNYFLLFRDFGRTTYSTVIPGLVSTSDVPDSYKIDEKVKFYSIDTINSNMSEINRALNSEIISDIKKHFDLDGDFYFVHSPLELKQWFDYNEINALITIAKDTLDNFQSYYQVSATFEPQKRGKNFELSPHFNGTINYRGKFKDNIGYWEENIGHANKAKIKYRYYHYYLNPIDSSYTDYPKLHKIEIISYSEDLENIIMTLKNDEIFKLDRDDEIGYNAGLISEFRPEMFRYFNGEYFIATFLPQFDEYMESYPPVFHLDTINWKLKKIDPLDSLVGKEYSSLRNGADLLIMTDYKAVSRFLNEFDIVKINDDYRLLKK